MKSISKKFIRQRSIIFIICFLSLTASIWADDLKPLWPKPSAEQWYWYEPETGLSLEQVDAILRDAAAGQTAFWCSKFFNSLFTIRESRLELKKGGNSAGEIRFKTSWVGINGASGRGSYNCSIPLDSVRQMSLFYNSRGGGEPWQLKMALTDSSFVFYFKDEKAARQFGNAFGSILAVKGLGIKVPKLGVRTCDLTPGQVEALEKSRIENALIIDVAIDSPADQAGLRPLDVITEFDGVTIKNNSHFISLLEAKASGTKVTLTCLRREKVMENDKERFVWTPKTVEIKVK